MNTFKSLPLNKIHVPSDRSREVDEDHARVIQASIIEQGQITPIMVRHTPNGKAPYELVAGAHRMWAMEMLGEPEIDCIIVKADKHEAAILEVSENIFRNDLTALDRAVAVQVYREAWEEKYGKIKRGGDQRAKLALCSNSVNLTELMQNEVEGRFSEACGEKLGLSSRAIKRANQIAQNLPKELRKELQGTPAADNQSMLLRFARLSPAKRKAAAKTIDICKGDISEALDALEDKASVKEATKEEKLRASLWNACGKASEEIRQEFINETIRPLIETSKDK